MLPVRKACAPRNANFLVFEDFDTRTSLILSYVIIENCLPAVPRKYCVVLRVVQERCGHDWSTVERESIIDVNVLSGDVQFSSVQLRVLKVCMDEKIAFDVVAGLEQYGHLAFGLRKNS